MDALRKLFSNKANLTLVVVLVVLIAISAVVFVKFFHKPAVVATQQVDLPFAPDNAYAILDPRLDGNALVLNITRVSEYDAISYTLDYQSNGIDRGVQGDIKKLGSNDHKSEYTQEILFGTCSQGYTTAGPHCVFDPNVENGTLTLLARKSNIIYRMIIQWHLQKPDVALGQITSGDGHFIYQTSASRQELAVIGYTIVNDLSGVPKLPAGLSVVGKVYALNVPPAQNFLKGTVSIELANPPGNGAKIARYDSSSSNWSLLDTKTASSSSTLVANADGGGIFAVLAPSGK